MQASLAKNDASQASRAARDAGFFYRQRMPFIELAGIVRDLLT